MSLKKPRIHLTGISNIDYKSKQDIKKIFNNFKNFTNNQQKPGEYEEQKDRYKAPKPRSPNLYNVSLQDAQEQSGDSLMYADTYKIRNIIRINKMEKESEKKQRDINSLSNVYNNAKKIDNNKLVETEKNEGKKELQTSEERIKYLRKCVKEKLVTHKDIKNIFLIWQKNYLKNQELSVYDLHQRINELDIPLSYNEALGLIHYANKRNTDSLNYDEFKNLFFDDSNKINKLKDLTNIIPENVDSQKIEEDNKKENEEKNGKFLDQKVFKHDHYITLESMLHIKNSNFINSMNEINDKENNKNGTCDFPTFKKVLDTLRIPEKFKNISIAKSIYNEFKIPNKDLMNYANFIEKCKNVKQPNNFFEFQNNYLDLLTKKLINNEKKRKKYGDILLEEEIRRKEYAKNLNPCSSYDKYRISKIENNELINNSLINSNTNNELIGSNEQNNNYNTIKTESNVDLYKSPIRKEKNDYYIQNSVTKSKTNHKNFNTISYDNNDTFSHYQPSLNFINLIHKDSRKYLDRYKEGIKELSPLHVFRDKEDRFKSPKAEDKGNIGGYYQKFRKMVLSCDLDSPGYIDTKERFEKKDIVETEKKKRIENLQKINKSKLEIKKKWNDNIDFQQKISEVKESLGQIKRTQNKYEYENRIIERNKLH